jgi:hypothetical protein
VRELLRVTPMVECTFERFWEACAKPGPRGSYGKALSDSNVPRVTSTLYWAATVEMSRLPVRSRIEHEDSIYVGLPRGSRGKGEANVSQQLCRLRRPQSEAPNGQVLRVSVKNC